MRSIIGLALRIARNRDGATAIEYAFLAAFIAMGIVGSAGAIGTELRTIFVDVEQGFPD